jgi:hypothetical protein
MHSTPINRHSRPSLQAVDHHRNPSASGKSRWNPVSPDSGDRILESGQKIPARTAGFQRFWQIPASMPESGQPRFRRNYLDFGLYLGFWL